MQKYLIFRFINIILFVTPQKVYPMPGKYVNSKKKKINNQPPSFVYSFPTAVSKNTRSNQEVTVTCQPRSFLTGKHSKWLSIKKRRNGMNDWTRRKNEICLYLHKMDKRYYSPCTFVILYSHSLHHYHKIC